jgi:RNA polymerase sigma-70 factor (ECF subfamily)
VFTIPRRRLVDDWRRRGRCPRVADDDRDPAGYLGGDVEDDALAHLGTGSVRCIRGLMPDDQRAVVLLRLLGDLTVEQGY